MKKQISAVIIGAGHRSMLYASWALKNPDKMKIVGVVDPNPLRIKMAAEVHNIPSDCCFSSIKELFKKGKIADAAINGTMDHLHIETSLPLLENGYHLLLEKPICNNEADLMLLLNTARKNNVKVMICHVLRYAPFYAAIKEKVYNGEIGEIINIQTAEHVSYHHTSVSYVRGKHNNEDICHSTMLMAKCCHDLDLITWFMSGIRPKKVASFGNRMFYRQEKADPRAGTRCMTDCPIESECVYSAKKIYLDRPDRWSFYVWDSLEHLGTPTLQDKEESLKTNNPHGRCIFKCDNNVVDHQSVMIEFENGTTATHNMVGGTAKAYRKIHILGTMGEIIGNMEDNQYTVIKINPDSGYDYTEECLKLNTTTDMHGGGDLRLVEDFAKVLLNESTSLSTSSLEDSVYGHLIGFSADQARVENTVISINDIKIKKERNE